ncbi:MAG: trypsin-like peptidase domain-containing protein [Clostridia bacterium]|nr:trypsin-like peptidase domain-containing protein [Clostridia bacterium]
MNDNNDFYKKFDNSNVGKFKTNVFLPFISGVLGTTLVLGLSFGIPGIRNSLISSNLNINSNTSTPDSVQTSNSGTVDYISLNNYSDTATYAANKVLPSIVGITVEYTVTSNFIQGMSQIATAKGSGIIISSDGYILTNNHIINSADSSIYYEVSEATKVYVYLYNDETPYEAHIIGTDKQTDLAVIKIEKDGITAAELGDSNSIKIGEFTMAIGNPLGMQSSVTSGIISAMNRTVNGEDGNTYTLIQTDAAINSGNSGGALINSEGKVIGINTLKLSGNGIEGMGFAIPINDTIDIYKQLIENGKVLRPYIGITGIDLDQKNATNYNLPAGIYIKQIQSNSPASSANIKAGDVITAIDNTQVTTMNELNKLKEEKNIGDKITLDIYRNGETLKIDITLAEQP